MTARGWRPAIALGGLLTAASAQADQPLWELGVGAAALSVPQYRGSDQSRVWLLPVPYFVYRGQILRADREGTRAVFFDRDRVDLDLGVSASPPANSSGNRARSGMPSLSPTLGIGPNLNVMLAKGSDWKLELRLPVRAVFTVQSRPQDLGWTFNPVLNLDLKAHGWNLGLQGGPLAASRDYDAYYYDVAAPYASATRPAYRASGGSAGWAATASASRRLGNWWLGAFWRHDSLAGASFGASPLVVQRSNATFGVAASWVFKTSETRVADPP